MVQLMKPAGIVTESSACRFLFEGFGYMTKCVACTCRRVFGGLQCLVEVHSQYDKCIISLKIQMLYLPSFKCHPIPIFPIFTVVFSQRFHSTPISSPSSPSYPTYSCNFPICQDKLPISATNSVWVGRLRPHVIIYFFSYNSHYAVRQSSVRGLRKLLSLGVLCRDLRHLADLLVELRPAYRVDDPHQPVLVHGGVAPCGRNIEVSKRLPDVWV